MSARFGRWLKEWDWRPLARLIVWIALAVVAAKRGGYRPPSLDSIARELILGWLLSFGLLTWLQIRLAAVAVWLYLTLDDWTYAVSEWIVRPVAGCASFAASFVAAFTVQIALVLGVIRFVPMVAADLLGRL